MVSSLRRPTLRDRVRYRFDALMSRGTVALIAWLWLISTTLILGVSLLVYTAGIHPGNGSDRPLTFIEIAWMCLMRTLDAGTMGQDQGGWPFLVAMLFITSAGLLVVGTLIGILSAGIDSRLQEMRKGRSFVVESDHVIILGWSEQIFLLIQELLWADRTDARRPLAILAPRDKVAMEDEIRKRLGAAAARRVICRSGDPLDLKDLEIVNPHSARAIAVLPSGGPAEEAQAVQTILALTGPAARDEGRLRIVTIVNDEGTDELIEKIAPGQVQSVHSDDLIARLIAQTCRQPGLAAVYHELLTFTGNDVYFVQPRGIEGRTFGDLLLGFEKGVPVGLRRSDGMIELNPPMSTRITAADKVIVFAEEPEDAGFTGFREPPIDQGNLQTGDPGANARRPEKILMLGWNQRGPRILHQLQHYVVPGTSLAVASDNPMVPSRLRDLAGLRNLTLDAKHADISRKQSLSGLDILDHDHVILLGDSDRLEPGPADARSLVTLLHLRELTAGGGRSSTITCEILDAKNRDIFDVTRLDDFILSGQVGSLMMAQIIENPEMSRFFDVLLEPAGSEFYLKGFERYVAPGRPVDFATVIQAARERGEVAIGYRLSSGKMVLNPPKRETVIFRGGDRIAVLAEN